VRSVDPGKIVPPSTGPLSNLSTALATGLGSGFFPFAPGTAGSAVGLLLFWPLHRLPLLYQVEATAALFAVGVCVATDVARRLGIKDPGIVVIDEVLGMWVSLLDLPFTLFSAAAGFVLFRLMDILKPPPARQLEHLSWGWGIMADDLMAGVYANLGLRLLLRVWSGA